MSSLAPPQVVSCYFDDRVTPHLAAMRLRWPAGPTNLRWLLPTGEEVIGPPPERFGVWGHAQAHLTAEMRAALATKLLQREADTRRSALSLDAKFAPDSPLEQRGFEPPVPP